MISLEIIKAYNKMNDKLELKNKLDISNKVFTKNRKEPKKTKIKVLCNYSVNDKNLYFTNFLERKNLDSIINTQIVNILKSDGKELSNNEIPFDITKDLEFDDNTHYLKCNKDKSRIPAILKKYGVEFEEEAILKCYGKSKLGHEIAGRGILNDTVRVFVKLDINDDVWKVILIDPYHLVATELYKDNYSKYRNNQIDISKLEPIF